MKKNFICSKKSVRTFKLRIEPYFLSHAERGESLQNQDFLGGIHLCRRFAPTPFRLPIPIFNFGGERGIRTLGDLAATQILQICALDQLCDLSGYGYFNKESVSLCFYWVLLHSGCG